MEAEAGAASAQSQITITQQTTITAAAETAEPAMVSGSTIWVSNISPCVLYSVQCACTLPSPSLPVQELSLNYQTTRI